MRLNNLLIITISILLSFFALSYKLSAVPPGIYSDEAVTGINALSILETGKDEYGKSFPAAFRFFGSYSPPLYTYLTVVPVFLFGLNEFSVRIVSVIAASLMIIILYWFLTKSSLINKKIIPFMLLLFIITPWNFFYARTGYELYLGFFLFSLAGLLLWLGLSSKKLLIPGLVILSLSTYGSYPQIFAAPLFFTGFLVLFFRSIDKKYLLIGTLLAAFIQIPHLMIAGSSAVGSKGDLFYIGEINNNAAKIPLLYGISFTLSLCYSVLARVVNYFSPNSLFFFPDPDPQRSMPEISVFYNWMVVPFLIGIYILLKNLKDKFSQILLLLAFVTVMPAALTKDPFSTQRALPLLLPLFLIISLGISKIYQSIGFRKFLVIFGVVFLISTIMLWRAYFVLLPAERATVWGYGYKDLAGYILSHPEKHFVIEQTLGKPAYSNLAFYLKTDPTILQASRDPKIKEDYYNLVDFNPDISFENIETRTIVWEEDIYKDQVLIGNELAISKNQAEEHFLTEVFKISDPRGYPIFFGYQSNPTKKCENTNNASVLCQ